MKKFLSILGSLGLTVSTVATVVACGEKKPPATEDNKEELATLITTTNLGTIKGEVTGQVILDLVKQKNSLNIDLNIIVDNITESSALLKAHEDWKTHKGEVTVSFQKHTKPQLSTLITHTDLGIIRDEINEKTILDLVKEKNPGLPELQVTINDITNSSATINALDSWEDYQGQVIVSFQKFIKSQLSTLIANTDLGVIRDEINEKTILDLVKQKNPGLPELQVNVNDITDSSATITALESWADYQGQVVVSFEKFIKPQLSTLITNLDLGIIYDEINEQIILDLVKEKNPGLPELEVSVTNITDSLATITALDSWQDYQGQVEVTFEKFIKAELSTILINLDLGLIEGEVNEQVILELVKTKNPLAPDLQVSVTNITDSSAIITALDSWQDYQGQVVVSFEKAKKETKEALSDLIKNTFLGVIRGEINEQLILDLVKEKNPRLPDLQVSVTNITDSSATITALESWADYQGQVVVSFEKFIKPQLSTLITNLDLGIIYDEINEQIILDLVKENNPRLPELQVSVTDITNSSAIITALDSWQDYQGQVEVRFEFLDSSTSEELKELIINTDLGKLEQVPSVDKVIDLIKLQNPSIANLKVSVESISEISATVKANDDWREYHGQVTVNFITPNAINFAKNKVQGLIVGDHYNLSQKAIGQFVNQGKDAKIFDFNSLKDLEVNDGSVGKKGGILELIPGNPFKNLTSDSLPDILEMEGDEVGVELVADLITGVLTLLELESFKLVDWLGYLIPIVPKMVIPSISFDDVFKETIKAFKDQFNRFINDDESENFTKKDLQPIISGLKSGTDFSKYANLTIGDLYEEIIPTLYNAIGYGLDADFVEVDKIDSQSVAVYISQAMSEGKFANFDLNNNPEKIVEKILQLAKIINIILSVFRTPEVDLNQPMAGGLDRSLYLFSNTETNGVYYARVYNQKLTDLSLNLKGLNMGELIANLTYYLDGSRYHLQKLFFILFYKNEEDLNPMGGLISDILIQQLPEEFSDDKMAPLIKQLLGGFIILPLVNNKPLLLDKFVNDIGPFLGFAYKGDVDQLLKVILKVHDLFAENGSFNFLYSGDLLLVIEAVKPVIEEQEGGAQTYQDIMEMINGLFGTHPVNLETLFTKLSLAQILSFANVAGFENINIPNFGTYYTEKSFQQLVQELGKIFNVNSSTTNEELKYYYFDFELLEVMMNELLYAANGKDSGVLDQLLDLLLEHNDQGTAEEKEAANKLFEEKFYEILQFDAENGFFTEDSFLGHFVIFLAPETKDLFKVYEDRPANQKFLKVGSLQEVHDNFSWIMTALIDVWRHLEQEDLTPFLEEVFAEDNNAFEVIEQSVTTDEMNFVIEFDPQKVIFADQSSLAGGKIKYEVTLSRNKANLFEFSKVVKITE